MKNLIIYYSKYGHTKRYAEFLKTRIGGDILSINEIKSNILKDYDNIIFGSSIRRSNIVNIKKFLRFYKKIKDKNVFIFANGFSTMKEDDFTRQNLIDMNELYDKHIRFYLLPGGFCYRDLKGLDKIIMDFSIKAAEKNGQSEIGLLRDREIDLVNPSNLDRIVYVINRLENENQNK